jgi:dipeptide/tripeptide permease
MYVENDHSRNWLDYAKDEYSEEFISDVRSLLSVLYMMLPLPIFWTLYDQQGTSWTAQAMLMSGDVSIFGYNYTIKPDQMGVTNAIGILATIPIFEKYIYPCLNNFGVRMRPLQRMAWGIVFLGVSFMMAGFLQGFIDPTIVTDEIGNKVCKANCVHVLWQIPQYIVLTAGEVMFSITGLEFAYSQAPSTMKSVCQSAWLMTVAFGNLLVRSLYVRFHSTWR